MTDGDRARRFDALISSLVTCHTMVRSPTYQRIEEISEELQNNRAVVDGVPVTRLPRSTIHDLLNRPRRRSLRWELVVSFWATLRRHAEDKRIDTSTMCSLAELERHYQAADIPPVEQARHDVQPAAADTDTQSGNGLPTNLPSWSPSGPNSHLPGGNRQRAVGPRFIAELQARNRDAPWRRYQDVVPDWFELFLMLEPELSEARTYAPLRIPSLLQTGEYARRTIAHELPELSEDDLARKVELRLLRQELIHRPEPLKVWAIIHERVLRDNVGSPPVWRAQIRHLIGLSGRPNITIQVITEKDANAALADGPLTVMRFPESHLDDMVFLEQRDHGLYLTGKHDVAYFSKLFASLIVKALPPEESHRFLQRLL